MGAAEVLAHFFTWLFVFAVPWQDMVVLPGLGTMSRLLGMAALGATALQVLLRAKVRRPTAFHGFLLAFMCWVFLSSFWSIAHPESIERKVNSYVQILVMVWILWENTLTRARLASLLQAYVLGGYVAAVATINNYAAGQVMKQDAERFAATGFDANDLGMLLALGLPMAWYLASMAPNGFQRWLNRAYFVVGTLAILLTSSRGAMIASLVALSVIPLTLTHVRRGVRVASIVVMILAGGAAAWLVPAKSFERLSATGSQISEGDLTGRVSIWKSGLRAIPRRAFHGYGPAGWYPAAGAIGSRVRSPHNTYLSILVEEGIVGLLLYLGMFVVLLIRLRTLPSFERRIGLALLATLAIAILPLGWDVYKALWLILSLLAAWSVVFARERAVVYPQAVHPPFRRPGNAPAPAVAK